MNIEALIDALEDIEPADFVDFFLRKGQVVQKDALLSWVDASREIAVILQVAYEKRAEELKNQRAEIKNLN